MGSHYPLRVAGFPLLKTNVSTLDLDTWIVPGQTALYPTITIIIIIIIIEGLSLLQSIPPTTANKQTQAQKKRGSMARKLLGANAKSYRLN